MKYKYLAIIGIVVSVLLLSNVNAKIKHCEDEHGDDDEQNIHCATPTPSPTPSPELSPTPTPEVSPTSTPEEPTPTPTPVIESPTPSPTPEETITPTPTPEPEETTEPTPTPTQPPAQSSGGSSGGSINPGVGSPQPAEGYVNYSTSSSIYPSCTEYLHDYIKLGKKNDIGQVLRLQVFLNIFMSSNLTLTGIYDEPTYLAVHAFQLKYSQDILLPWVSHGLKDDHTSTGYVYKTTKYKINQLMCPAKAVKEEI